ncbi:MAG: AAA family ATPase, partial [Acidimicrobiales bacterium]
LLPSLEQAVAHEERQLAAARVAEAVRSERRSAVATMRRDLEVRAAGLEERRAMCTRRIAEIESRLAAVGAAREEAARRREELEAVAHQVELLDAAVRGQRERCKVAGERLRTARQAQAAATRHRLERIEHLRAVRQALERQLFEAREQANRASVEEAEARVRLEALAEMVHRELDCEPEEIRDATCPPLDAGTTPAGRRTELERELRMMGPVNPLAMEEHQALSERHEFLTSQLEDVKGARRELTKVIRAVDTEMSDHLLAAYGDVADNFEALFSSLFPGGEGRLRLTDPDHILETGIEVEARPSGKLVRRLSLLSGGERSLVALAFLFAVFRSRPSPFYLLDEVEAALDDVNLQRFLGLLGDFRNEAQLLVVTHQKRTMEAGDCLYGVSMPPGGSSRVISERLRDPAAV